MYPTVHSELFTTAKIWKWVNCPSTDQWIKRNVMYSLLGRLWSEVKWSESESRSVMSNSLWPQGLHSPWNFSGQNTGVGSLSLLQGNHLNPGIEPRSSTFQAFSLPAEPQGKPKNTGVDSLSLLQRIFLTQQSNQGLLHHRRILYQLSYEGRSIGRL